MIKIKGLPPKGTRKSYRINVNGRYFMTTKNEEKYNFLLKKCHEAETLEDLEKIKKEYGQPRHSEEDKDIYKYGKMWRIIRNHQYFGSYDTIEEARKNRKILIKNNWNTDYVKYTRRRWKWSDERGLLDKYIYLNKTGKYTILKNNEYFGTYNSFEEAKEERDLLERYDWDITGMVEGEGTLYQKTRQ